MPIPYVILILVLFILAAMVTYIVSRIHKHQQTMRITKLKEKVSQMQQHEQLKHLVNRTQDHPQKDHEPPDNETDPERFLAQVVELTRLYMPQGNATVETIAAAMGMSVSTFRRHLIAITGQSPKVFLLTIQMDEAARKLLDRPDELVKIIADECGFSEVGSFARTFKRVYGLTPTEYREQAEKTWQQSE